MSTQVVASRDLRFLEDDSNTSDVATPADETNIDKEENTEEPIDDNIGIDFMKWYKVIIFTVGVVAVFLIFYALSWLCKYCCIKTDTNE